MPKQNMQNTRPPGFNADMPTMQSYNPGNLSKKSLKISIDPKSNFYLS